MQYFLQVLVALFLLLPVLFVSPGFAETASPSVTFHFYGAEDCPPCMAFKRNHLSDVRAEGEAEGFAVAENIIEKTREIATIGIFGNADVLLRRVGPQLLRVYPPIFFVTDGEEIVSVDRHDWRAALASAKAAAGRQ
ncbi:MAG: hypothetical protein AAGE61_10935 [Pseudomonadota bacterium]